MNRKLELAVDKRVRHAEAIKTFKKSHSKMSHALIDIQGDISANEADEWITSIENTIDLLKASLFQISKRF